MGVKPFVVGVFVGAVLCGAVFLWPRARPGPEKPTQKVVIESPTPEQKRMANSLIRTESKGELSGDVILAATSLMPGDGVKIPVTGSFFTVYKDAETGEVIGQGEHPITGETVVRIDGGRVETETTFKDSVEIAVTVPEPPKQRWRIGAGIGLDGHGEPIREVWGQYDAWQWSGHRVIFAAPVRKVWCDNYWRLASKCRTV